MSNVRRPTTPVVNQSTGERVPSMCPPHPPSSDTIDDTYTLGVGSMSAEDDNVNAGGTGGPGADGAYRPINTAKVMAGLGE